MHFSTIGHATKEGKAALPNTQKQKKEGCQNEETKKYGPNEIIEQNSRKRTKHSGDNQPIRCRVQNMGDQDAQGTHWVLQQHKKRPTQK